MAERIVKFGVSRWCASGALVIGLLLCPLRSHS
jgi:hypothetical protein